ncbi:MAG: HAD family hydrolase [Dehalococcoidia bacterium]|nr:HAD family hydrolase [Dehalococcoidia bacterium]
MSPRAVFFDMDDTLLDTSGGVAESWRAVCQAFAPELGCDPEDLNTAIRHQMMEFWKDEAAVEHWRTRLHDARTHNIGQALAARKLNAGHAKLLSDRYWDEQSNRMKLFDDALETLDRLRDAGFRLALLTNGPAEMQRWKLGRFPIAERVDVVVIEGEFGHGKPDARVFQHALASVGANPDEAWHVGDNLYADIRGAQGAGIHATWIHRDRLELKDDAPAVPDRVIGHLAELREALGL